MHVSTAAVCDRMVSEQDTEPEVGVCDHRFSKSDEWIHAGAIQVSVCSLLRSHSNKFTRNTIDVSIDTTENQ